MSEFCSVKIGTNFAFTTWFVGTKFINLMKCLIEAVDTFLKTSCNITVFLYICR